jgi:osmotically-inducible protein OsmY
VANDLRVHVSGDYQRTDSDIAQVAANALELNVSLPKERITAVARDGFVTLGGRVDCQYQKEIAFRVVRDLAGVLGVANNITVQPPVKAQDVQMLIEAALKRSAAVDARRIHVTVQDSAVILTGNVRSWLERQEAERAAWSAPGVTRVDDRVSVIQ